MTALICHFLGHRPINFTDAVTWEPVRTCSRCWTEIGGKR